MAKKGTKKARALSLPEPWYREVNETWYVTLDSRQIKLGKQQRAAYARYREVMKGEGLRVPDKQRRAKRGVTGGTLRVLVDAFLKDSKKKKAESTYTWRVAVLEGLMDAVPEGLMAEALTPQQVDDWLSLTTIGPTTINNRIAAVSSLFHWGIMMRKVAVNPIADMPRPSKALPQFIVPEDRYTELLGHCGPAFHDFVFFMLYTGARVEEMFKLTGRHYHKDKGEPRFVLNNKAAKGRKRSRVIFLSEDTDAIAKGRMGAYPRGHLFRNTKGKPWDKDSINNQIRRLKRLMDMPELRATTFRHCFCTRLLSQGVDSYIVAKLMGHADTTMISQRYGHLEQTGVLSTTIKQCA